MSKSANDKFYEAAVAPLLLKAAVLCQGRGLPMLAIVQCGPRNFGETRVEVGKSSVTLVHDKGLGDLATMLEEHGVPPMAPAAR